MRYLLLVAAVFLITGFSCSKKEPEQAPEQQGFSESDTEAPVDAVEPVEEAPSDVDAE